MPKSQHTPIVNPEWHGTFGAVSVLEKLVFVIQASFTSVISHTFLLYVFPRNLFTVWNSQQSNSFINSHRNRVLAFPEPEQPVVTHILHLEPSSTSCSKYFTFKSYAFTLRFKSGTLALWGALYSAGWMNLPVDIPVMATLTLGTSLVSFQ